MNARSSRRDFIRGILCGALAGTLFAIPGGRTASTAAATEPRPVDRRQLGRTGANVSILGLGLGSAFMEGFASRLDAGHALLESALAQGVTYWDTARSYGPSEAMIAPVLARHRNRVFLASKTDARDYDGFRRDLEHSLQVLGTDHLDLYQLHDLRPRELASLAVLESGAVRAAREAKEQKLIGAFGITGHASAGILMECIKRFDPDTVLSTFPCTRPDQGRFEDELLPLARARKMGVVAMKAIRYAREAKLPARELLRYTLSLEGVTTAIVGLDSLGHLNENAQAARGFQPLKEAHGAELSASARQALAEVPAPWDRVDYVDGGALPTGVLALPRSGI
ncbi:MAG: aldo/keto reductase [Verrucomicrobia bacterium]|nr:aldo/keto reductase [Verrucomicrobiota bacterium]